MVTVRASPARALQVAIAAALLADANVSALVGTRVWNPMTADPDGAFPSINLGPHHTIGDGGSHDDGSQTFFMVHVFGRGPSADLDADDVAAAVRALLAPENTSAGPASLPTWCASVVGCSVTEIGEIDITDAGDPDPKTAHLALTIPFFTQPGAS